eukprot:jgi/Ulvmu1/1826/UM119_0044.1
MTVSEALSILSTSSAVTTVTVGLILLNAGLLLYALAWRLCASIAWLLHIRSSAEKPRNKKEHLPAKRLADDVANDPRTMVKTAPGKSIKKLLKETKKLAALHSHEKVPESDLFVASLKGHSAAVLSTDIAPDCTRVVTACEDNVVRVFYMNQLEYSNPKPPLTRIPMKQTPIRAAFWGAADRLGVCTAGLGEVVNLSTISKIVHGGAMPSPQQVSSGIHDGLPVIRTCSAPQSPGGTPLLGTLTKTKEARVVTGDGTIIATVQPNGIENYQIALSPDGHFLAVTTFSTDVKIWELQWARDKTFLRCVKVMDLGHSKGVASVTFNVNGTKAATSCKDGSFRLWNINVRYHQQEDPKLMKMAKLKQVYDHMVWCPNDVIVCAQGRELHWMNGVEECCSVTHAHDGEITSLSCTSHKVQVEGRYVFAVASAGRDGKVRIWNCSDAV